MPIIAVCGFQNAGKDTFANYLIQNHGFIKLSFASALKDIIAVLFSWDRNKLEGIKTEDRTWRETVDPWWSQQLDMPHLTPRFVMQYFGTDLFRNHFHPNIWVKAVERQILLNPTANYIITDCRFGNEIELVKQHGGILIHIARNLPTWYHDYKNNLCVKPVEGYHPSDISWIRYDFDHEISNHFSSIDEFNSAIKSFLSSDNANLISIF